MFLRLCYHQLSSLAWSPQLAFYSVPMSCGHFAQVFVLGTGMERVSPL